MSEMSTPASLAEVHASSLVAPEATSNRLSYARLISDNVKNSDSVEHAVKDFAEGLAQGFLYSSIQSPLEGAAQTFDQTIGRAFDSHCYEILKDQFIAAPEPAKFSSAKWHGQTLGSSLGIIPLFLTTRAALRGSAGLFQATENLVVREAEALTNYRVFSKTGTKLALEGGVTGALYAGLFKSVENVPNNYWSAKSREMAGEFASFSTLSASSIYFGSQLKSLARPLLERYPAAGAITMHATSVLAGALSGIPAAGVNTIALNLSSGGKSPLTLAEFGINVYSSAVIGASLSAFHPIAHQIKQSRSPGANGGKDTTASFESWLKRQNDDPYTASIISPEELMQVKEVWPLLNKSQKRLSPDDLYRVAVYKDQLQPGQWQSMTAYETLDHLSLITNLQLEREQFQKLFDLADFKDWAKKHPEAENYQCREILKIWDKLPLEFKSLPPSQLSEIAINWRKMTEKEWQAIPAEAAADVANAARLLSNFPSSNVELAKRPDAAKWIRQASMLDDINEFDQVRVLKAWSHLTAEQRSQPTSELIKAAKTFNAQNSLEIYFGSDLALKNYLVLLAPETQANVIAFIEENATSNLPLLNLAIEGGVKINDQFIEKLRAVATLTDSLGLDPESTKYLIKSQNRGVKIDELNAYLEEKPKQKNHLRNLISARADVKEINARHLINRDDLVQLGGFSLLEKDQLLKLHMEGLATTRLLHHLNENPNDIDTFKLLLKRGAEAKQLNDFMSLAVFPPEVNLKLVEAVVKGELRTEDILAKLKDWHSGSEFRDLTINHVQTGANLTKESLQELSEKAMIMANRFTHRTSAQPELKIEQSNPIAYAFLQALQGIENQIPRDKTIVLLGRDAWPLLPLLRNAGRDAQYFLWSRLQLDDTPTRQQWLKEIPQSAAVIDTGYDGSIISIIKDIDPHVSGYLMSSNNRSNYPTLLSDQNHGELVGEVENLPKLIHRSRSYSKNGGAISRRNEDDDESELATTFSEASRWNTERQSRELLKVMGLPAWDVWRYSQFTGLTAMERLGVNTREAVAKHYQSISAMRESGIVK